MQANAKTINFIQSASSAVSGSAAGILGLTGIYGFIFYFITAITTNATTLLINAKGRPGDYFKKGAFEAWTDGLVGGLFGYVLFWTLAYGLVHVYD